MINGITVRNFSGKEPGDELLTLVLLCITGIEVDLSSIKSHKSNNAKRNFVRMG